MLSPEQQTELEDLQTELEAVTAQVLRLTNMKTEQFSVGGRQATYPGAPTLANQQARQAWLKRQISRLKRGGGIARAGVYR